MIKCRLYADFSELMNKFQLEINQPHQWISCFCYRGDFQICVSEPDKGYFCWRRIEDIEDLHLWLTDGDKWHRTEMIFMYIVKFYTLLLSDHSKTFRFENTRLYNDIMRSTGNKYRHSSINLWNDL